MSGHDRLAAQELIHKWWYNYDEGNLAVLEGLLTEDCHTSSRTELGTHPHEEFIRSDNRGRDAVMAWKRQHRQQSPYPLRHHAANVHTVAERGDEPSTSSPTFLSPRSSTVARAPSPVAWCIGHSCAPTTATGCASSTQSSIRSNPHHSTTWTTFQTAKGRGDHLN